jgi:hypothetical protein
VWDGQTCSRLLAARPQLHLILVDRWEPPKPNDSYATSGAKIAAHPQSRHTEAYNRTMKSIAPYMDRVLILKGDSVPMAENIEDNSIDFVFIDGDHSEEGVSKDIKAYLPKIKKGGFLSGHDWNGKWGTEKGVLQHFKRERVSLDANSTWFISV